jgi:hypothetical protein
MRPSAQHGWHQALQDLKTISSLTTKAGCRRRKQVFSAVGTYK